MRILLTVLLNITLLIILGGVGAYLFASRGGFSARQRPAALEYAVVTPLRNISAATQGADLRNPLAGQPDAWRAVANDYAHHCAMCHNVNGKGATLLGSNINPPTPDMTRDGTQQLSDAQLFAIIRDGVRWTAMPSWREIHSDDEIWRLVALVRHLPRLRLDEMDLLNPALIQGEALTPIATTGSYETPHPSGQ